MTAWESTLAEMLTFAEWQGGASQHDVDALKDGLDVIRKAMDQPIGTGRASKTGEGVTEEEYDGALLRVIASAMVLYLSGALDTLCLG